jgi:hypothetical protein
MTHQNSGVYILKFKSGKYYIGKTNDFERRWKEHFDKFDKGTAALKMQMEYNRSGYPSTSIMITCHEDHIGLLEANLIHNNWSDNILNASRPKVSEDLNQEHLPLLCHSTGTLGNMVLASNTKISNLEGKIKHLQSSHQAKIRDMISGTYIESQERVNEKLNAEIKRLKSRNWLDRLLNK